MNPFFSPEVPFTQSPQLDVFLRCIPTRQQMVVVCVGGRGGGERESVRVVLWTTLYMSQESGMSRKPMIKKGTVLFIN